MPGCTATTLVRHFSAHSGTDVPIRSGSCSGRWHVTCGGPRPTRVLPRSETTLALPSDMARRCPLVCRRREVEWTLGALIDARRTPANRFRHRAVRHPSYLLTLHASGGRTRRWRAWCCCSRMRSLPNARRCPISPRAPVSCRLVLSAWSGISLVESSSRRAGRIA